MRITVFGASGKVGRLVVENLLAAGHTVIAFVHTTNPFDGLEGIEVVKGSVDDPAAVNQAIKGSDGVISALGSWGTSTKTVVSIGTKQIVQAMSQHKVTRLITLTGASAFYSQDQPSNVSQLTRTVLRLMAPKILRDGELHLENLEASDLDWTCIRSSPMTGQQAASYRLSTKLPTILKVVPRRAVAQCMIDQLTATDFLRKAPVIYRD